MASLFLKEVAKALGSSLAKELGQSITGDKWKEAAVTLKDIQAALKDIADRITLKVAKELGERFLQVETNHIETWRNALQRAIELKNSGQGDGEIERVREELRRNQDGTGINYVMTRIQSLLCDGAPGEPAGIFKLLADGMQKDLCNHENKVVTIKYYLTHHYIFVAAQLRWVTLGTAVQVFMSGKDKALIDYYLKKADERMKILLRSAQASLNPFVARLKGGNYLNHIDRTHWWQVIRWQDSLNRTNNDLGQVILQPMDVAPTNVWRFEPPPDESDRSMFINWDANFPLYVSHFHYEGQRIPTTVFHLSNWRKLREPHKSYIIWGFVVPEMDTENFKFYSEYAEPTFNVFKENEWLCKTNYHIIDDKVKQIQFEMNWDGYTGHRTHEPLPPPR